MSGKEIVVFFINVLTYHASCKFERNERKYYLLNQHVHFNVQFNQYALTEDRIDSRITEY